MADETIKRRCCVGLLAHVDAGKTTLAEALLYSAGSLRSLGRVDKGDAFLDTFTLERQRGITIFSKQAVIVKDGVQFTILDTPGHADLSSEMERTLSILDCAVLVIGGSAGVQSHTRTLWKLLREKKIPTFLFVSKMDQPGADREQILSALRRDLSAQIVTLAPEDTENLALCEESMLEEWLETGIVSEASVVRAVARGNVFPVWFGAALKLEGVDPFLEGLSRYAPFCGDKEAFSARVYKIARDAQGARETHLKILGGVLKNRQTVVGAGWEEKITQLRVYSGAKYKALEEARPGDVVAVTGLTRTSPGMGLGDAAQTEPPALTPVLTYQVVLPEGFDVTKALACFRQLEEEDPQLHVDFHQGKQEIRVQIMGPIQLEILQALLRDRFRLEVSFSQGSILYRETIADMVEGVGHYEPLRHYAEVRLLLEPGERGSGLVFGTDCSENELDRNWQRLILTHLLEKQHLGVLTGAPITDMRITLVAGKAHLKHTEGGDFRQATYRAVRQGLMTAESILLEPWYDYRLELPQEFVGRAMTDLQRMGGDMTPPVQDGETVVLTGSAPVSALREYPRELTAYSHGLGSISFSLRGYEPCPNQADIVEEAGYDPEADLENTPDSVFCGHGAGYNVKWYDVPSQAHLPAVLRPPRETESEMAVLGRRYRAMAATDKELQAIFERTYGPIRRDTPQTMRTVRSAPERTAYKASPVPAGPEYVLVDGYNIIFAWDELCKLAGQDLSAARDKLVDMMRNYQSFRQSPVILVFDAYKVKGNKGSVERYGDLSVVYTREAQTADAYIEKLSYELGKRHRVRVATSDGMEQVIILGHGCLRVPARVFRQEVLEVRKSIEQYLTQG